MKFLNSPTAWGIVAGIWIVVGALTAFGGSPGLGIGGITLGVIFAAIALSRVGTSRRSTRAD